MRQIAVPLALLLSTAASAEPLGISTEAPEPSVAFGARIGGYGFRRDGATAFTGKWDECRMNGVGVFAQKTVRGPLFAEAGLDTYFSMTERQPR